jgi:hypothetical protein
MNPGIFLISDNEELVEWTSDRTTLRSCYKPGLQYPQLLVGNQLDANQPRRFLLYKNAEFHQKKVARRRWSIDHLFLDQDALPTLVEVKRSSDTWIRREVVGQMLDYAANAVTYWPVSHMRERFAANCQARGLDPDEKIKEFLEEETDAEEFWQRASRNTWHAIWPVASQKNEEKAKPHPLTVGVENPTAE